MSQRLWIPWLLPGLNEILTLQKQHTGRRQRVYWNAWATEKAVHGRDLFVLIRQAQLQPVEGRVTIQCEWVERDRARDPDNIVAGGRKIVHDSLVACGILTDDSRQEIGRMIDEFFVDAGRPGVLVTLLPWEGQEEAARCHPLDR